MYFFIQKIVEGDKFIDWADLIAKKLHRSLVTVNNFGSFFISSFLIYVLVESKEWEGLPHFPWMDEIPIYQYNNDLQEVELFKEFRRVNDVFLGKLVIELQGHDNNRISMEAIQVYVYFYIQFPKFTYLRMGGFSSEPLKLPCYCLDFIVLFEMCR